MPDPVDQTGVPSDVIKVQMSVHYIIDVARLHASARESVEEIRM